MIAVRRFRKPNLCMKGGAHNRQVCGASRQRVDRIGGSAGSGNGDPIGCAAAFGGFGFLGPVIFFTGFGGGASGLSSANTGLGSIVVEPEVA